MICRKVAAVIFQFLIDFLTFIVGVFTRYQALALLVRNEKVRGSTPLAPPLPRLKKLANAPHSDDHMLRWLRVVVLDTRS